MNKNIKLAVAGAVIAMSASAANAGIIIPAGDWTLDINGNVNAYANYTSAKDTATISGGLAAAKTAANTQSGDKYLGINTGLLPAWLGFTATTRQNDLDVTWNMSMQPNVSDNNVTGDAKSPLFRTAYFSFGDKSWGTIKLGKDIGIFASDAILNDMTLLGVGANAGNSGASTTLGGIGTGYMYAAWKGQVAYTTPNMNGFQATVAVTNPNQAGNSHVMTIQQDRYGFEAKASYAFETGAANGKVWVSGLSYDVASSNTTSYNASAGDIGATINANGFGLTGYYYTGKGIGTTTFGNGALVSSVPGVVVQSASTNTQTRESDGGYIQLTYALPTKTKLGIAYGESNLDLGQGESTTNSTVVKANERMTVGAYHPLTKHLNLVAEYNNIQSTNHGGGSNESQTYSLGGILFF